MKKIVWFSVLTLLLSCTVLFSGCTEKKQNSGAGESPSLNDSSVQSQNSLPGEIPDISGVKFEDAAFEYDGQSHALEVYDLPNGVTVSYENNGQTDAGEYTVKARLSYGGKTLSDLEAKLEIRPKNARVLIDDLEFTLGDTYELTYKTEGFLPGDDPKISLSLDAGTGGIKQVTGVCENANYKVTFEGGKCIISAALFDSSDLSGSSPFLPDYAPFALYDTSLFSNSVITEISFPFYGLASGYTVSSANLYMPVYVVKSDFTTSKSQCTVENGKKILLDFTGKLSGVKQGDWLTVKDLHIELEEGETLAFGDADMAVLPGFLRNDGRYGFWNRIFGSKGQNNHSLVLKIVGYSRDGQNPDDPDNNKNSPMISFLGDSISTYSGWSNNTSYNGTIGNNAVWFPNGNYAGADMAVTDTWWYRVAKQLGYEICVNNSYSGSVVKDSQTYNVRARNLHNNKGKEPDVIVIFMGVNDFAANTAVGTYDGGAVPPTSPSTFSEAYGRMLYNMMQEYENAEIYCCTFLPDRKRFSGDTNGIGASIEEYNGAIRTIARNMGAELIDLYDACGIDATNISTYTVDRLHPNAAGMALIAETVSSKIGRASEKAA